MIEPSDFPVLSGLHRLTRRDSKIVSWMFSRAFQDWPIAVALQPDPEIRRKKAYCVYAISVNQSLRWGEAYSTTKDIDDAITWVHSKDYNLGLIRTIQCGALTPLFKLGFKVMKNFVKLLEYYEEMEEKSIQGDHLHLTWIGVAPEKQKQGRGKLLMKGIMDRCAQHNLKCFLDTQEEVNVPYYEALGFEVTQEGMFPDINVPYWGMVWDPKK